MKRVICIILSPLFRLGLLPKLKPTGIHKPQQVYIGEKGCKNVENQIHT